MQAGYVEDGELKLRQQRPSPSDFYNSLFEVKLAQSEEDILLSQKLRYRVYCEETGFLNSHDNPDGFERDALDERSIAVLLIRKTTGQCVGTVRMILPDESLPLGGLPARTCSKAMSDLGSETMPVRTTAEISRFTIAPEFRRRSGDTLYQQVYDIDTRGVDTRRVIPYMALGLFAGIFEVVLQQSLTHLCAIIDPALLRMLARLHLHFTPVGGLVDFYGQRQPVIADCSTLYAGMRSLPPEHLAIVNRNGALDI